MSFTRGPLRPARWLYSLRSCDWLRRDHNGAQCPVHVEHAFRNLNSDRRGDAVRHDFVQQPRVTLHGNGWHEELLGSLPDVFFEVRRLAIECGARERRELRGGREHPLASADRAGSRTVTDHPVLEVGGTHARACRIDTTTWRLVPGSAYRLPLDSTGGADAIIATIVECTNALHPTSTETLAVAIPGPFDYPSGVGRFEGVGKFDALAGVDLRRALLTRLAHRPARVTFVNDAQAFGLGEWLAGSARGYQRVVALTLGTGVGSAFLEAGRIISSGPSIPPGGEVYRLVIRGRPLEETMSRRAIIDAYRDLAPPSRTPCLDVHDIASAALSGDPVAARVFAQALRSLGEALAPWLVLFKAEVLVVGGGLSASWTLIDGPVRAGLGEAADRVVIVKSADTENSIAVGAAWHSHGVLASSARPFVAHETRTSVGMEEPGPPRAGLG